MFHMEPRFVHLRLHTEYSLRDGLIRLPDLMERAHQDAMPAIAFTDFCNLYATVKFYKAALDMGIKPIIGIDVLMASEKANTEPTRLTLLCQNLTGYKNLLQLVSKSFLEGQSTGRPTIQRAWLTSFSAGLIALSGGHEGDLGQALIDHDKASALAALAFWQQRFPNRFYIEVSRTGKPAETSYLPEALAFAEKHRLPVVATNDVRFLSPDDYEAHEARVCIQEGAILSDPQRTRSYTEQQYFRSQAEMQQLFADIPAALANTIEIAKRCNVAFELGKPELPHFPIPDGFTIENYFSAMVKKGLEERLATTPKENVANSIAKDAYEKRLERELDVINKMGFAGYFLIVADFTKWAKENGIPVGPGRGSGPGSLVAYSLKITDLDPLALDLLFERFLNPERVSMPDFDIDFCMEGRDRVIEYVMQKHGYDSVSQIMTYGTMAAKAVVRDVGRVLALGYGFVDKIAKLIPFELGMTLEKALEQEPLLKERYEQEEEVRTLIDLALKLEGLARNVGKHAGGIVIAPGKLTDFVPLYCEPNEAQHPVTQFDKDDVEAVGLVKFDFLGLKTLTIIDRALRVINQKRTKENEAPVDISLLPLDDEKTFQLLKACQSTAVFQLESHGMRDLIKRLQPDCFEDLIALVALFRPGPLQSGMVDDFINRKHGRAKVIYPHPDLEPILRPTYGVILYQEQVMQIAQVLAGYTLGAADILRRAMGKKKPEEMAKQREIFCDGATARGVNKEVATHIFDLMEKFAGYGFNKSHSAAYALIAYQTAWLKAHYTAAFMAAVLTSDMDRTEKVIIMLEECKVFNINVIPPEINSSEYYFKVLDDHTIMHGLGAIKGMGEAAIENIISVRNEGGTFANLFDFCQRVDLRKINRRALETLTKAGCFDQFGIHRASLFASTHKALQQAEQTQQNAMYGQHDFLSFIETKSVTPDYVNAPTWLPEILLQGEKETLGFYLSGHPLDKYQHEIKHLTNGRIAELRPTGQQTVRAAGIITNIRTRQTKRGDRIAIFTLDDGKHTIDVVCFSECFQTYRHLLTEDQLIIAEGEVGLDEFSNQNRFVCRDLYTIDEARAQHTKYLRLSIKPAQAFDVEHFKQLVAPYLGGSCPIVIQYQHEKADANIKLGKKWLVKPTEELFTLLQNQLNLQQIEWVY